MQRVAFSLIILLLIGAGLIFLQIFLSKKSGKWPGLVMPVISFLFSFVYLLNIAAPSAGENSGVFLTVLAVFLTGNIPTAVLLAIYFACREKMRKNAQLNKMNIQDLS